MSSFIETGMPKGWSNTAGGVGAALLGVGAAIGLTPELVSYTEKHPEWAFPVVFLFLSFLMFVLVRMFRGGSRPKVPEHPQNDPVAATDINAERQPYTCKCEAEQEKGDDDTEAAVTSQCCLTKFFRRAKSP